MKTLRRRLLQRGVAAIEMALLLIPLVLFTLSATELGRALYYYNTLLKSTRDGARYLSMQAPGSGHAVARCLVVYGNTGCAGDPVVAGLETGQVSIAEQAAVPTGSGSVDVVTVTVTGYSFTSFMPAFFPDTVRGFAFADIATTMRQAAT